LRKMRSKWKINGDFPIFQCFPDLENADFLENHGLPSNIMNISEYEILSKLRQGFDFPPLSIRAARADQGADRGMETILDVRTADQPFPFAAELRTRSTPRDFEDALRQIGQAVQGTSYYPMLVIPYLRDAQLQELERRNMSGIDLSGNGVVCIPG